jgi:hypothetical protein
LLLAKNPGYCAYLADVEYAFFHASEDELCFVEAPKKMTGRKMGRKWSKDRLGLAAGQTTLWPTEATATLR